jgi:hypothetical protein
MTGVVKTISPIEENLIIRNLNPPRSLKGGPEAALSFSTSLFIVDVFLSPFRG